MILFLNLSDIMTLMFLKYVDPHHFANLCDNHTKSDNVPYPIYHPIMHLKDKRKSFGKMDRE